MPRFPLFLQHPSHNPLRYPLEVFAIQVCPFKLIQFLQEGRLVLLYFFIYLLLLTVLLLHSFPLIGIHDIVGEERLRYDGVGDFSLEAPYLVGGPKDSKGVRIEGIKELLYIALV